MFYPFKQLLLAFVVLCPLLATAEKVDKTPRALTLVFVGGSGGDGTTPTLNHLKERLAGLEPKDAVVVFTGNYSDGELPIEGDVRRDHAERDLMAHVNATQDFFKRGGRVFFLPGYTDFGEGGTKAVRRMRKFLNQAFEEALGEAAEEKKKVDVMPQASCGTPTDVDLTDNLGILLVNSQWWMQDWLTDPDFNDGCEAKTRGAFNADLTDTFRNFRHRRLIIASHHPLASYGERGGAFTARAHASPVPIVGTAWVLARQAGLVPQYRNHPMMHSYISMVRNEADRNGAYIFVSGQDGNLQYVSLSHQDETSRQVQLIAGTSGNAGEPVTRADEGDFSAPVPGWIELAMEPTGAGEARFFSSQAEPLFQKRLPQLPALADVASEAPATIPQGPVLAGYSKTHVWEVPGFIQLFIGNYYSDAFALKLPYEVLDLKTEQGGLVPYKIGGGLQSNSVRVHDSHGGDWAIRATTKDSSRLLPYPMNQISLIGRLLEHGFTATHPEAALAVPPLAEAVGVLHLTPRLMYLPDQEALGDYRGFVTDEVVVLEQRAHELKDGTKLPDNLGGKDPDVKFKDYEEMVEKLADKPEKNRVDQETMLRARLLDMLIGDWDRHRGQWRFAVTKGEDDVKTYTPIPMDRDQALGNYDGIGLMMARLVVPQSRSLQPFTGNYGRIGWLNYNARDVDARLLNTIPREKWMAIAAEVKAVVTDKVIDAAMATWHPEAYTMDGATIAAALKQRRDKLLEAATAFYEIQARHVDVVGSNHDDQFDVSFVDDGAVRVVVSGKHKDKPYYDRTFQPSETAELNLYGLDGDDKLEVHGNPHTKIGVRFVGGKGKDKVTAAGGSAEAPVSAKAIVLYDHEDGAKIDPSVVVDDQRSEVARLNQYEPRENHEPDYGFFMPGLLANPDDGVFLGGKFTYVVQGYKKAPFAAKHELSAYFATATLGAAVDYRGLFPQSASLLDQQLDLTLRTPQFTRNFYGYTNARIPDSADADYFRVRQAKYEARYGLSYGFGGDRSRVGAQLVGQAIITEQTVGRFVEVTPDITPDTFGPRYFGGARIFAETNTFDSLTLPRRGIALHGSLESRYDLRRGNQFSTNYKVAAAVAVPFDQHQRVVLLSRASFEGIVGEHPFYFAPSLGDQQLRAYHQQQLTGDFAFAQTTDLRVDVFRFHGGLPGTMGFNLSLDHGRVGGGSVTGQYWHMNYGGGLWWSIVDLIGVSVNYHRGLDGGERISLAVGPLFAKTGF